MKKIITHKDKIFFASSSALLFTAICAVIYYICGPAEGFFHSDCTDSLYWANASIESGKLIAPNFRYAALLPFSANLYMIPLIKLFGMTMKTQIISMVIFALLYVCSQIWLFRSMKFSYSFSFAGTAFMLMLFSSSIKMREIMWEHVIYYSLSILFFNCLLALIFKLFGAYDTYKFEPLKKNKIRLWIYIALFALSCLFVSANGLPIIVMTTLPICAGVALTLLFKTKSKLFTKEHIPPIMSVGIGVVFSAIGFLLLQIIKKGVTADYTNVYSMFSGIEEWADNLLKLPMHFVSLLGFIDNSVYFLSFWGIRNALAVAMFVILLLTPIISLCFYKKIKSNSTKILLLSYIVLFLVTMFIFICGNISGASWRIIPLIGVSAVTTLALIHEMIKAKGEKTEEKEKKEVSFLPFRGAVAIILVLALFSSLCFASVVSIPKDYGKDNELHQLTDCLIDNELTYGYATFWNSQAITLLSDSKVKCREILVSKDEGAVTDYYQSSFDWYQPQDGVDEYFVLLEEHEYYKVLRNSTWQRWEAEQLSHTIRDVEGYVIVVFNGYLDGIMPVEEE